MWGAMGVGWSRDRRSNGRQHEKLTTERMQLEMDDAVILMFTRDSNTRADGTNNRRQVM